MMTGEDIRLIWLNNSTCSVWRSKPIRTILLESDTHIVLKHNSHAEYLNMMDGNGNCNAYAVLYAKADIEANPDGIRSGMMGLHVVEELKRWEGCGRITEKRVMLECAEEGIEFNLDYNGSAV